MMFVVRKRVSGISCGTAERIQVNSADLHKHENMRLGQNLNVGAHSEFVVHFHEPVDENGPHIVIDVSLQDGHTVRFSSLTIQLLREAGGHAHLR